MIVRTGIDIINLRTATKILNNPSAIARMLSPSDIARNSPEHIAGRLALKEAVMKAVDLAGTKNAWQHIHISQDKSGRPLITFDAPIKGLVSIDGSIAHHGGYVAATATALYKKLEKVE